MNTTTRNEVLDVLVRHFYPFLKKTEDFDSFIHTLSTQMRELGAEVLVEAIEAFDDEIRTQAPRAWSIKDRPARTIVTLLGKITYERTLFIDEWGRTRYLADEILGIPKRSRFSQDAFLWIVSRAAFVSFRKTAKDFKELTGATVSHVSVMKMVHEEGALIKDYLLFDESKKERISQDRLFVEADGVFVALQSKGKRKQAIKRHLYERTRKKRSIELKCGVSYAGKAPHVEPTRKTRGNVLAACTTKDKNELFDMVAQDIMRNYNIDGIQEIFSGSDGAPCYKDHGLDARIPHACFTHTLDPFHISRSLAQAFPDKKLKSKMYAMVYAGEMEGFVAISSYLKDHAETQTAKENIHSCTNYLVNNADIISFNNDLGTMEGTISHVIAKRMKNNATSWSVCGAEAMGLVRCFVCTGRRLIAPSKKAFFTDQEHKRKEKVIATSFFGQPQTVGEGHLPFQARISHMRREISYRAAYPR